MPETTRRLTLDQVRALLGSASLTRRITEVHLHHTWRPRRADFRGAATIEAMRRYHMDTLGWSDIAQHVTLDPQGHVWTGRNWNRPPASQSGRNGDANAGPLMIEMVGDFDEGQDPFDGAQRAEAVKLVALLLAHSRLPVDALKFHRDLGSPKSCPGTGIDRKAFARDVAAAVAAQAAVEERGRAFSPHHLLGFEMMRSDTGAAADPPTAEVPETDDAGMVIASEASRLIAAGQARVRDLSGRRSVSRLRPAARDVSEWQGLRPHVVNLSKGQLSAEGEFRMDSGSLSVIAEGIRAFVTGTPGAHILLYAHGGLVSERSALEYARGVIDWWQENGVYPVFFIWETGILDWLQQRLFGARAFADATDRLLEGTAGPLGRPVWSDIKESARLAANVDAGDGVPGGAWLFAGKLTTLLGDLARAGHRPGIHAIGHSAGAIFHAYLVDELARRRVEVASLSLLAPAVRVDLFKQLLLPHLTGSAPAVRRLAMFTMSEEAELQDDCWNVYRKSLLHFVSRGFEPRRKTPILGLEESVRADDEIAALFAGAAELQLSQPPGTPPNELTGALRHGDFDNDPKTMSAVLRRMIGAADATKLGEVGFPYRPEPRAIEGVPVSGALPAAGDSPHRPPPDNGDCPQCPLPDGRRRDSGRRALCVGINAYRERPLLGCVNDAQAWGRALEAAGFGVTYLLDRKATRSAMVDALGELVDTAVAGDSLAFVYAGHGTQFADEDGDEPDRFDEAFAPVDCHLGRFLLDDDLAAVLSRLAPGAVATLFMDCCHSGTNSRFAPAMRPRVASSERVRFLPVSEEVLRAHRAFRRSLGAAPRSVSETSLDGIVHFAACQDDEFAFESDGQGDFTRAGSALVAAALARRDTNEAFLAAVRSEVARRGRQHPLLMQLPAALRDRPLLSAVPSHVPAPAGAPATAGESLEGELLAHVEAMAALLRARLVR
jgi:hypothetical protein